MPLTRGLRRSCSSLTSERLAGSGLFLVCEAAWQPCLEQRTAISRVQIALIPEAMVSSSCQCIGPRLWARTTCSIALIEDMTLPPDSTTFVATNLSSQDTLPVEWCSTLSNQDTMRELCSAVLNLQMVNTYFPSCKQLAPAKHSLGCSLVH